MNSHLPETCQPTHTGGYDHVMTRPPKSPRTSPKERAEAAEKRAKKAYDKYAAKFRKAMDRAVDAFPKGVTYESSHLEEGVDQIGREAVFVTVWLSHSSWKQIDSTPRILSEMASIVADELADVGIDKYAYVDIVAR